MKTYATPIADACNSYDAFVVPKVMNYRDILIVDDDKDIVAAVCTILQMQDYTVRTAYNGTDCLKQVLDQKPQLILLDLMLPDINGKEVATLLAQEYGLDDIPIVVLSAAREARDTASEIGAKACIEKPFDMQLLLNTVAQCKHN